VIDLFTIVFSFRALNDAEKKNTFNENYEDVQISNGETEMLLASDVPIPDKISFAGERTPLERIDIREALTKELIVYTYLHSHTIQIMKKVPRYFAVIEPILKKVGLPEDFKYLAVIESGLEPLAVSPSGAVGLWQFMEKTAKEYGLEINNEVDERYNIEKATYAAADYLKKMHDKFGTWTMAAAAYNAGGNMINKQIDTQNERTYYSLLLGEETERYVFRILAVKQILNHPELYHFYVENTYPVEATRKYKIRKPVKNLALWAADHEISYKTLKRFNPWLRKNHLHDIKNKDYEITIPRKTENYK
jgi:hypothetical protein